MMAELKFVSSRGGAPPVDLSEAISQGLAPDGGLYVPTRLPAVDPASFRGSRRVAADRARSAWPASSPATGCSRALGEIADAALDFAAPTTAVIACRDPLFALELFHGPTAAFKDFGARFLAESLQRLKTEAARQPLTILVATSGDTGGAVAAAFHRRPWARVVILYPSGSGESAAGAAADLLGRECRVAARRRHLR